MLAYSLVRNAIRIQISPNDPASKNVNHNVAFIEMDDKRFFLERAIKENEESKFLVFVRTRVRAERVSKAMERVGIKSLTIHGNLLWIFIIVANVYAIYVPTQNGPRIRHNTAHTSQIMYTARS